MTNASSSSTAVSATLTSPAVGAAPSSKASSGPPLSQDAAVIGLVGLAHATSHFFHMMLVPLFPVFMNDFGLTFSQLGLLTSVFFVVSGVGQSLAGFVVDRLGAAPVLFVSLGIFVLAALTAAVSHSHVLLVAAAALAGLANAPFHPVDFTILNQRVSTARLGYAFSTHGVSGNLGWAVAPVFYVGITALSNWRTAYVCAALLALGVLVLMVLNRDKLRTEVHREGPPRTSTAPEGLKPAAPNLLEQVWTGDRGEASREPRPARPREVHEVTSVGACKAHLKSPAGHPAGVHMPLASDLDYLKLPVVWWCFGFFLLTTMTLAVVQTYSVSVLKILHGVSFEAATATLTAYMLAGAVGMLCGGFAAARVANSDKVVAITMTAGALLMALCATGVLGATGTMVVLAATGFALGVGGPSRDMMIKKATPKGATGRVYGTVYSGLDVGFAVSPLIFGAFMDRGWYAATLAGAAVTLLASVFAALGVGRRTRA